MKWIILTLSLAASCIVAAQDLQGYPAITYMEEFLNPSPYMMRARAGSAYGTKGSPNIFDDFVPGVLYFSSKMKSETDRLNYNCYSNEVLYSDGSTTFQVDNKKVDFLEFHPADAPAIMFEQVFLADKKKSLFLQILYNESSKLYKRHFREFKKADYGGAYSADRRFDEYIDLHDYYLSLNGGDVIPLKPKKKNLLNIMYPHGEEIEKFLKSEKIDLKNDNDLEKVVRYFDSLSTQSQ